LVTAQHQAGASKADLYRLISAYAQLQTTTDREYTLLLDVLDALSGFCNSAYRLIPEEPDVNTNF